MMKMFEPELTLSKERDGEYTLHAVTITPNSCYSAGRAKRGVPPNVRLLPEVEPVLLDLRAHRGPCLMVLTPVHHRLGNLKLGPAHGKTSVTAFVMLDDRVVGSANIRVDEVDVTPGPVTTSGWYAWANLMPPGPASLHVQGVVSAPTPGYEVALRPAVPQGINPRDLILDLVLTAKPGIWPDVVTPIPVSYVVTPYSKQYDTVLVKLPSGDGIQLTIEDVH
jgi:hypothetical protein